jgi:hypothetical protein
MPKAWSKKDEKQYEHIRKSEKERGRSDKRAKEIAARTVNQQRRKEGRTPNRRTQGSGNRNRPLEERTVEELRNLASGMNIEGRSRMKKAKLVQSIRSRR